MDPHDPLFPVICTLVDALVRGAYTDIERDGRSGRLTAAELRQAIVAYGRRLVPLPDEAAPLIAIYPQARNPDILAIDIPLWTAEEGQSDLTLSITAERIGDTITVQIEDIHVL